ncbi:unnamed protein product, partial [Mesorhabditis spiculigera]
MDNNSVLNFLYDKVLEGFTQARDISPDELAWPLKLLLILLGYSTVALPCFVFIYYVRQRYTGREGKEPNSLLGQLAKAFAIGHPEYLLAQPLVNETSPKKKEESSNARRHLWNDLLALAFFFMGIQSTLVMMGFFQERIITQGYPSSTDPLIMDKFGDAQFLVFCNRIIALVIVFVVLGYNWSRQPPHVPPFYQHAWTSFSNTISSWCQYEALKYVSFPTQTICKASKVVATMVMGTIVRGQRYSCAEYLCGAFIAAGASVFLLASSSAGIGETTTTVSGMILMFGYLVFDAFTLNWQKKLFDVKPKVSKYQMMFGVNVFSAVLCAVSLAEQGTLFTSMEFATTHRGFIRDVFLLSLSGATGQLFIYSTIERFGPIVFSVIMTIRQMLSILLSSFYYGHPMSAWAFVGFFLVFGAMFSDIYRRYSRQQIAPAKGGKHQG